MLHDNGSGSQSPFLRLSGSPPNGDAQRPADSRVQGVDQLVDATPHGGIAPAVATSEIDTSGDNFAGVSQRVALT
jgi:hypothetical protein